MATKLQEGEVLLAIGNEDVPVGQYTKKIFSYFALEEKDLAGGKLNIAGLQAFMPLDCGATPPPKDAVECGLQDLWRRTAGPMPEAARPGFRACIWQAVDGGRAGLDPLGARVPGSQPEVGA